MNEEGPLAPRDRDPNESSNSARRLVSEARQLVRWRRHGDEPHHVIPSSTLSSPKGDGYIPPDGSLLASAAIAAIVSGSRSDDKAISTKYASSKGKNNKHKRQAAVAPIASVGSSLKTSSTAVARDTTDSLNLGMDIGKDLTTLAPQHDEEAGEDERGGDNGAHINSLDASMEQRKSSSTTESIDSGSSTKILAAAIIERSDNTEKSCDSSCEPRVNLGSTSSSKEHQVAVPDVAASCETSSEGAPTSSRHSSESNYEYSSRADATVHSTHRAQGATSGKGNYPSLNKPSAKGSSGYQAPTETSIAVASDVQSTSNRSISHALSLNEIEGAAVPALGCENRTCSTRDNSDSGESNNQLKKMNVQPRKTSGRQKRDEEYNFSTSETPTASTSLPAPGKNLPETEQVRPRRTPSSLPQGHNNSTYKVEQTNCTTISGEHGAEGRARTKSERPAVSGEAIAPSDRCGKSHSMKSVISSPYSSAEFATCSTEHSAQVVPKKEQSKSLPRPLVTLRADAKPFELQTGLGSLQTNNCKEMLVSNSTDDKAGTIDSGHNFPTQLESAAEGVVFVELLGSTSESRAVSRLPSHREPLRQNEMPRSLSIRDGHFSRVGADTRKEGGTSERIGTAKSGNVQSRENLASRATRERGVGRRKGGISDSSVGEKNYSKMDEKKTVYRQQRKRGFKNMKHEQQQEKQQQQQSAPKQQHQYQQPKQEQRQRTSNKNPALTSNSSSERQQEKRAISTTKSTNQCCIYSPANSCHTRPSTKAIVPTTSHLNSTITLTENTGSAMAPPVDSSGTVHNSSKNDDGGGGYVYDTVHFTDDAVAQWAVAGGGKGSGEECVNMLKEVRHLSGVLTVDLRLMGSHRASGADKGSKGKKCSVSRENGNGGVVGSKRYATTA